MIQINNIKKSFEDITIFENFSLSIPDGEFLMITGESGKGKTTLLNMIGALEDADSGEILVNGIDISEKKNRLKYFREGVSFLFQNYALINNKTVLENLNIVKKDCRSDYTIDEILAKLHLSEKKDTKVYKLSGGEQQRVALARVMLKKSDIILADEPTGSLDRKNAKIVMEILQNLHQDGKTIVMVTHNEELLENATKVVRLTGAKQG